MIEPWVSNWSRLIYENLHHEEFNTKVKDWSFPGFGPLSCANGALPWIVFNRDLCKFKKGFPELELKSIEPMMPFCYLLSGGVSMRSLAPGWSFNFVRRLENKAIFKNIPMFAGIIVSKK
jgi:hypothetical protein